MKLEYFEAFEDEKSHNLVENMILGELSRERERVLSKSYTKRYEQRLKRKTNLEIFHSKNNVLLVEGIKYFHLEKELETWEYHNGGIYVRLLPGNVIDLKGVLSNLKKISKKAKEDLETIAS